MKYSCECPKEPLILEPEDWSEEEWKTLLKLFGLKNIERIKISDYKLEAYGIYIESEEDICTKD